MWVIFDSNGEFVYSISSEPNPSDVVGKTVIKTDQQFDFTNKRYFLSDGNIDSEDFVYSAPPPASALTLTEKLESVGISIDELKQALGV